MRILPPLIAVAALLLLVAAPHACGQATLTPVADMVLDNSALLMPLASTYGRAINGESFQADALFTYNGYQYATWYHNGTSGNSEDLYIARRNLSGTTWDVRDTGSNLDNGDSPAWDAHNVASLGISGDGHLHISFDMHGNTLRYRDTAADVANNPGSIVWNGTGQFALNTERSALNSGGTPVTGVTYPQYVTRPTGDMLFVYRTGASGNGDMQLATYNATTHSWNSPHQFINGTSPIFYDDAFGAGSNERNAYINGVDVDATGRLHVTWTWREAATGSSNHDICYAYSDDGGDTWRNNAGTVIGTAASPINLSSPGIVAVPMDRGNTLMNQQAQVVDNDNRVHVVMWHKTDEAAPITGFTTTPAAYFHYFRDPTTSAWTRNELPASRAVGSRPDLAYDADGNMYAAYLSPGPGDGQGVAANYYTEGDLIIASASKATGYDDWQIVHTDYRDFSGEPRIDQRRLTQNGVLSILEQENSDANTGRTGTPLHVIEFNKLPKHLVWAGGSGASWNNGPGSFWDSDGNNTADASFANGYRATFDDGAATFAVNIASPVEPASMNFRNSSSHAYNVTGAAISGTGGLMVAGGGMVTLANATNGYSGNTEIVSGTLALSGSATISASPSINVGSGGQLDVTATSSGSIALNNQTLTIDGNVSGNVVAINNSTVNVNSSNAINGNLTAESGSSVRGAGRIIGNLLLNSGTTRVGGDGMPVSVVPVTTLVDDFSAGGLAEYTLTRVLEQSSPPGADTEANVSFSDTSGALVASYGGTVSAAEQVLLLRGDANLAAGQTLRADVSMAATTAQMDLGLAVSSTAVPTGTTPGTDLDTRDTFDAAIVSIRPSANNLRVNKYVAGASPDTTTGTLTVDEATVTGLYIRRNSNTQFVVGYTDSSSIDHAATSIDFATTNVGTAIGFYGDLRAIGGALGNFDNLRIVGQQSLPVGETLTIDGSYTQNAGSNLELDIYSPTAHDSFHVGDNFSAGGTLDITLVAGAPSPQPGDLFDILDFTSATGTFATLNLPTLTAGLNWNTANLLTSGILEVVAGLPGDFNSDGQVDSADYVRWRKIDGTPEGYNTWRTYFGTTSSGAGTGSNSVAVPEPVACLSNTILCVVLLARLKRPWFPICDLIGWPALRPKNVQVG
jgi:hypothetical protein